MNRVWVRDLRLLRLAEGYGPQGEPERVASANPHNVGVAWVPDVSEIVFSSSSQALYAPPNCGLWRVAASASAKPQRLSFAQDNARAPAIRTEIPLMDAIVWLDARATAEAASLGGRFTPDDYYRHTGLPEVGPANPVSKILWIKNRKPDAYRACTRFLLLQDFLVFLLTGRQVTEPSLASSTGYFDLGTDQWWGEILDYAGIPEQRLPEVLPSGHPVGTLTKSAAAELGLPQSVMVTTGAMDQIAAALASGNFKPGKLVDITGSALIIAASTSSPDFTPAVKVTLYRHYRPGLYLVIPYCPTAGIILKWFKDEFCAPEAAEAARTAVPLYQLLDQRAAEVAPGSNGLLLLPHFAGILNPDCNPAARGVLFGIGLQTSRSHVVRAILESVGYMLRENVELLERLGMEVPEIHAMGGGAASSLWNSIKADITGKPVMVTMQEEAASLVAAMLGAIAAGWYKDIEAA